MSQLVIYFNPNCAKCRSALATLDGGGASCELVRYLEKPLDAEQLAVLLEQLEDSPADLVRKDRRFAELELDAGEFQSKNEVLALLLKHPELMQRPVVVRNGVARIARTPEAVAHCLL